MFTQQTTYHITVKSIDYSLPQKEIIIKYQITDGNAKPVTIARSSQISLSVNSQKSSFVLKSLSASQAVSILLLVDSSGSISFQTKAEIEQAIRAFVQEIRDFDETALFTFHDVLNQIQKFTNNKNTFNEAVKRIQSGGTLSRIYDSIYNTLIYINKEAKNQNKALIVVSDGLDEGSLKKPSDIIELSKKLKIPIYSLGYSNISPVYFENLSYLSKNTGGLFALRDSQLLASKIVSIEKSVFEISFPIRKLHRMNRIDLRYQNAIHTHYFQTPDNVLTEIEKIKEFNTWIIIFLIGFFFTLLLVLVIWSVLRKKKWGFSKEESLYLSHFVLKDAAQCSEAIKSIYHKMVVTKGLYKDDFVLLGEHLISFLEKSQVMPLIIEKIKRLIRKSYGFYKVRFFIDESYFTQIAYAIEGRAPVITDDQKLVFSKVLLEEIKHRLDEGKKNPVTLTDYDNYHSFITRTTYSPNELLLLIQQLEKGKEYVDKLTANQLAAGIDILKALLNLKQKNYPIGSIVINPYLNDIKSKLEKIDIKLNRLSNVEKKCLSNLVISAIQETPESAGFFNRIFIEEKVLHEDIAEMYKKLSSELMCAVLDDKEKSNDCSALYKISVILSTSKKPVTRDTFFNKEDEAAIKEKIHAILQKKRDPEQEKFLNDLFSQFQMENSQFTENMKNTLLNPVAEIALGDIIEGFLFKSFSAGSSGFNFEEMQREIDSYDAETLAKLMPFMIQAVMDSQGSEKEANMGILKQIASGLSLDVAQISNISDWDNWWKRNKSGVMKNISRLEEKKKNTDILGFTLHEDIVFYRKSGRALEEVQGKIIDIKESEISLLLRTVVELEEIIAVYARRKSDEIYTHSTYAFLRLMWIIEIEENVYECGFQFLKDEDAEFAKSMVTMLSGSDK